MNPKPQSVFGGALTAEFRDGRTARLEVSDELRIVVAHDDQQLQSFVLPLPRSGHGGHELLLSASERLLVLFLYSGQGQVGFEVFSMPELRHTRSQAYVSGQGFGPRLSEDEARVALAYAVNPGLVLEHAPIGADGCTAMACKVEWGGVVVHALQDRSELRFGLDVTLPAGFPWEGDDWWAPTLVALTAEGVSIRLPWGGVANRRFDSASARWVVPGPAMRGT